MFNFNDIKDKEAVVNRSLKDAESIMAGPCRNGRTDVQIFNCCKQGHIAEQWCIENLNMTDCDIKYHDLYDKNENIVEVKSSTSMATLENQYTRMQQAKWNNSDKFLGFLIDSDGMYDLVISRDI